MMLAASPMGADLQQMLLVSLMNPAVILVGFLLGRRANQPQKMIVAGFAAGFAGLAFVWLVHKFGVYIGNMNSVGGIFALSFLVGMIWCYIGYKTRKKTG